MCALRNIDCDNSRDTMIEQLTKALRVNQGEEEKEIAVEESLKSESDISFEIKNANSLKSISGEDEIILLSGNVFVIFKKGDEKKTLTAETIVIDITNSKLAALGNVSYSSGEDDKNILSQDISGEIVTLNWLSNTILVSGGSIFTERKNSEGESVVFNATSSLLTLNNQSNSLILKDGFITTNPKTAYSSISASKIAFLNNGDMYLEKARVSIGRVDVLYLPFFFSPGAKMIGNPSIGFELNRGAFVNTTFEIFGKYPDFKKAEVNSFTSLLQSENSGDSFASGPIYKTSKEVSEVQKWASSTNSYFALLIDAYEKTPNSLSNTDNGSVVLGYATKINLLNKTLGITSSALTSFASDGVKGDFTSRDSYGIFRYDAKISATLNLKSSSLSLTLPIISDPLVRKTYGNRLSSFSLDALWSDQNFPTTYTSSINSYSWLFDANLKIPADLLNPFIDTVKINKLKANIDYRWREENNSYSYLIEKMTLPQVEFYISGKLVDIEQKEKEGVEENVEQNDEVARILNELYKSSIKEEAPSSSLSNYNLSYNLKNNFYYNNNVFDKKEEIYNKSSFNLINKAQIEPKILNLDNSLALTYIYNNDLNKNNLNSVDILTKNTIQVPLINFSYYFDSRLYKYSKTVTEGSDVEEELKFEFSKDFITNHAIQWVKSYDINKVKLTPSLKLVLPPLSLAFKPSLTLNYNEFENKTIFTFDIASSNFELIEVDNNIKYKKDNFNFALDINYDVKKSKTALRVIDSLVLKSSIIYFNKSANQYFSYTSKFHGLHKDKDKNYFSDFSFTYKNDFLVSRLNFYTQDSKIKLDYFKNTVSLSEYTNYWWKNRIGLKLNVDSTFNYSFVDKYSTYFSLTGVASFKVAKFIAIDFSVTTSNYGFYRYYDNNKFNFNTMFDDLLRSFDIFGDGRRNTQFNLEKVSLDVIHAMEDWDLHCKYTGSVVLSDYNYQYQWVPSFSIFLQWKTIPELKVDQRFTNDGNGWDYNS